MQSNINAHPANQGGIGQVQPGVRAAGISNISNAVTDADAIAAALNDLTAELDAIDKVGQANINPEAIDDLVTIDMYTPLDQIPSSKRQFINPNMEMIPEEEKLGGLQNKSDENLTAQPSNTDTNLPAQKVASVNSQSISEIKPEHFQLNKTYTGNNAEKLSNSHTEKNKLQNIKTSQTKAADSPQKQESISPPRETQVSQNMFENLAGDEEDFKSRLMPKSDAYDIERKQKASMSKEQLKKRYKLQREETAKQQENLIKSKSDLGHSEGFLSGLSSRDPYETNKTAPENASDGLSHSGGFLQGLADNTSKQSLNNSDLFQRYDIGKEAPVIPHNVQNEFENKVWNSNSISPAAKAYRDQHMNIANGHQTQPVPQQNTLHPNLLPGQIPQGIPAQQAGLPAALKPNIINTPINNNSEIKKNIKPEVQVNKRRRKPIQRYFGRYPAWSAIAILSGLGLIASQHKYDAIQEWYKPEATWYLLAGICVVILSVLWRYFSVRAPKEEILDEWVEEDLVSLETRAKKILEIPNRNLLLDPIVMSGFPDMDNIGRNYKKGLYGKDHILRYTPRAITIMCFTHDQILTYEGAVDLTNGQRVYETAREFFYSDIATIGLVKTKVAHSWFKLSKLINLFLPWRWVIIEKILRTMSGRPIDHSAQNLKESFQISLKDGSRIEVILRDGRILNGRVFEEIPLSTDNQVIKAIKEFVVIRKNLQLNNM